MGSIEKLSIDKDERVRSNVARNPKISISILRKLAKDKNIKVRCSILNNPSLTKDKFYKLKSPPDGLYLLQS